MRSVLLESSRLHIAEGHITFLAVCNQCAGTVPLAPWGLRGILLCTPSKSPSLTRYASIIAQAPAPPFQTRTCVL